MFVDHFLLWLHIAFAIFAIGPVTATTMSTPRAIRNKNVPVLRYLNRTTQIFGGVSLLVFVVGLGLAAGRFSEAWLSASMTLFVVGAILLFALVVPDQRKALKRLESDESADVETGRILAFSIVVSVVWLVILILMIWQPGA